MAKVTDVLARIGSENIGVQYLSQCMSDIQMRKGVTEITFNTDKDILVNPKSNESAIICWVPTDKFNESIKALNAGEETLEQKVRAALAELNDRTEISDLDLQDDEGDRDAVLDFIQNISKAVHNEAK